MQRLHISTSKKRDVIDITEQVATVLPKGSGVATVFVQHTTAAITTADLDPGTDLDFLDFLKSSEPDIQWRHPHDPAHAPDHFLASIVGPSIVIPYENNTLLLGTWQRLILLECDGPRERSIVINT